MIDAESDQYEGNVSFRYDMDKNLLGAWCSVVLELKQPFPFYVTFKSLGIYENGPFLILQSLLKKILPGDPQTCEWSGNVSLKPKLQDTGSLQ